MLRMLIDASNIRAGGGLTHLSQMLEACGKNAPAGFSEVHVYSGKYTLDKLPHQTWLKLVEVPALNLGLFLRMWWQQLSLPKLASDFDVLFSPGGTLPFLYKGITVTMSQNLLPFEARERSRYPLTSWMRWKLWILRWSQGRSFRRATGVIFLTKYARSVIGKCLRLGFNTSPVIPHGIEKRFLIDPRKPREFSEFKPNQPARILYVSMIDMYKHQWNVVEAVARVREQGVSVELTLIGSSYPQALDRLNQTLKQFDPERKFTKHLGFVPFVELAPYYREADLFVFASTCENLPNILIEAMAAGLPILSSKSGPMPEVLQDRGAYFDAEKPAEIADQIFQALKNPELRDSWSQAAYLAAQRYSWKNCAELTFSAILQIVAKYQSLG